MAQAYDSRLAHFARRCFCLRSMRLRNLFHHFWRRSADLYLCLFMQAHLNLSRANDREAKPSNQMTRKQIKWVCLSTFHKWLVQNKMHRNFKTIIIRYLWGIVFQRLSWNIARWIKLGLACDGLRRKACDTCGETVCLFPIKAISKIVIYWERSNFTRKIPLATTSHIHIIKNIFLNQRWHFWGISFQSTLSNNTFLQIKISSTFNCKVCILSRTLASSITVAFLSNNACTTVLQKKHIFHGRSHRWVYNFVLDTDVQLIRLQIKR